MSELLRWFVLHDSARDQGLSKALLNEALAHVDAHGFTVARLWTFAGLDAARHLYERAGFVLVEKAPGEQWGREVLEQVFERRPA